MINLSKSFIKMSAVKVSFSKKKSSKLSYLTRLVATSENTTRIILWLFPCNSEIIPEQVC